MIKNRVLENQIELVFKLLYFAFTLISFNSFCARQFYISYISYVVVAFGALILINRLTHIKDYLNSKIWLLIAFIVSYILGAINTLRYGVMENIQAVAWMTIQFFAVFAYDVKKDKELANKEFKIITIFFIVYTMLMAIIGLVLMIVKYEYYTVIDGMYVIAAGFLFNRLWGCYIDPNYGAIFSLVSILLSMYYFKGSNKKIKIALVVNILVEYLYICYSDSRTGRLAIILSVAALVYFLLIKRDKFDIGDKSIKLTGTKKVIVVVFVALMCAGVLWSGTKIIKLATSGIKVSIAKLAAIEQGFSEEEAEAMADLDRIGRYDEEINGGDVSNNRFEIWESGIDIFKANPITGISFRNIIEYARAEMPTGFIATSGFESMHNFLVDILVSQGIIGIVILLVFIVLIIKPILVVAPKLGIYEYNQFVFMFASLVAIFVSMLTYSEAFYMNTGGAFLFWYFLGYISNYMLVNKEN